MRYFTSIRLALAPVNEKNLFKAIPNQLVITVRLSAQSFREFFQFTERLRDNAMTFDQPAAQRST